jgi:glycosyl transferase family 87
MRHPTRWAGAYALLAAMLASIFAFAILTGPYRAVERSDYMTYHVAGRIVVEARGDCLYTVECQARVQRSLIGEEPSFSDSTLPFTSPPWLAMLVLPLQLLSLAAAFGTFTAVSLLLLGIAAWRLAWGGTGTRLVATALVLSAWPTAMGAIRGQSSLGVAALVGLSASAALRGADGRVGLLAGLAAIKPTLLPLWGIRLIIERRWRAIAGAVAVVTLIVLLALVVVSPKAVADYPSYLLNLAGRDNTFGIHVEQMINWRGAAARLGLADSPLGAVGTLLTLALVTLGWWWARDSSRGPALGAAIAFVATPLVIPHANQHEAVLASLGILVAVAAIEELRSWLAGAAIGLQALLWVGPVVPGEASGWLLFAALIGCLLALAWLAWRERARYFRRGPVTAVTD